MNKVKTIITTDMEVDDMNSLIHLSLYLNEMNLLGIIYTSSQYHFNGDGIHTLGEITPNYRTSGPAGLVRPRTHFGPDPDAKNCMNFRPFPMGWIESLWDNQYRKAYPYLIQHDPAFPSPEYLLSITKYGNVEFEGDVRFDTEGSNLIKKTLLESSEPVYLQSWGGANTIVRALLSIYEEYGSSAQWPAVKNKVIKNTKIFGIRNYIGQDNSYLENRINEIYPDLELLQTEYLFGLHKFIQVVQPDCKDMLKGDWLKKNIQNGSSELMDAYHLMGDGKILEGEPDIYQFGLNPVIDFGYKEKDPTYFESYDFLGEGDSNTYIPLISFGLRGLENYNYGTLLGRILVNGSDSKEYSYLSGKQEKVNPFLKCYMEDWAARAKWCFNDYANCNHAPVIKIDRQDIFAGSKETIDLMAEISDPDNDSFSVIWEYYDNFSSYQGGMSPLRVWEPWKANTKFTVPADAQPGDTFSLILRVQDHAETPMTSFGQVIIHVQ